MIYGVQSLPCTGGTVANSMLKDLNNVFTFSDKTEIGDIAWTFSQPLTMYTLREPPPAQTVSH